MSIAEQLNRVREKNIKDRSRVILINELRDEPDILFYSRVEESVELFRIYHSKPYEQIQKYLEVLTNENSAEFRRERLTQKENENISKRLKIILTVITPYTKYNYIMVILEWLIRIYRIDKYELEYLVSATIQIEEVQEILDIFISRNPFISNPIISIIQCKGVQVRISKELLNSNYNNVCILKVLHKLVIDKESHEYVKYLEGVGNILFKEGTIPEEIICEWVNSLFECRNRIKKCINNEIEGEGIIQCIERILIQIRMNNELIDEIEQEIDGFNKNTYKLDCNSIHTDVQDISYRFSTLYAHFKRTGDKDKLIKEYPMEFAVQIISEKEEISDWISILKEIIFKSLKYDEIVELLLEKPYISLVISDDSEYTKLSKKYPIIKILSEIEREKEGKDIKKITKKMVSEFHQILPNRQIEKWIFKKVTSYNELKLVIDGLLPVLSTETIENELVKMSDWKSIELFLSEVHHKAFIRSVDRDVLISHFSEYIDTVSKYNGYTPLGIELSDEEREGLLDIAKCKLERSNNTPEEVLFIVYVYGDLHAHINTLFGVKSIIESIPESDRKRPIKALLEILSDRRDTVQCTDLFGIIQVLDVFDVDTTVSLLLYRTAISLDVRGFSRVICNAVLKKESGTVESKMLKCLRGDNVDLVSAVFEKYFNELTPQEILLVIKTEYVDVLVPGLLNIFSGLEQNIKIDIIRAAVEMYRIENTLLFSVLSTSVPLSILLESVVPGDKYSVQLILDTVLARVSAVEESISINNPSGCKSDTEVEHRRVVSLLLDTLIHARKVCNVGSVLCNWERSILPMRGIPGLLSNKLKVNGSSQVVRGLVSRYLKKNLPPTDLLLALVQDKVLDNSVLQNVLMHNPSSRSKVLLFRALISRQLNGKSLLLVLSILKDKKSSLLRYYVQSRLQYIVKAVLKQKDAHFALVLKIMCNLVGREKNVMHPYTHSLMGLIKQTRRKEYAKRLTQINLRYIINAVSDDMDVQILEKYVNNKVSELEPEEVKELTTFCINRTDKGSALRILVELFSVIENKQAVWTDLLRKTEGFTPKFIHTLHRMCRLDRKGACTGSLSLIYSRLEDMLINALNMDKSPEIISIMKRFFMHEKSTLISIQKVMELSMQAISTRKSIPGLISALFYSQSINNPSEAEGINHTILVDLVKADGPRKNRLFNTLYKIYNKNPDFISRLLGQSAPYFAILLESKDAHTRHKAEQLMKIISTLSGEDPYKFL
ncbi:hypothetical protein NEPAR03_2448 [Nematocida parisii]|nr:hypothetical protein NEPAR03_2448 [Nematocida parisii]